MKNKFHHRDTENTEESPLMSANYIKHHPVNEKTLCISLRLCASVVKGLK